MNDTIKKAIKTLQENMAELAGHEQARVQRAISDSEGSYLDDDQEELITSLAERFS
jgi:hypothetical protein